MQHMGLGAMVKLLDCDLDDVGLKYGNNSACG